MADRIHIRGLLTDPAQALVLVRTIFPEAGDYLLGKALPPDAEHFEEWYLRALAATTQEEFIRLRDEIWQALDEFLRAHGFTKPSDVNLWRLQELKATLAHDAAATLSGLPVRGRTQSELSFPALSYRFGMIGPYLPMERQPWAVLVRRVADTALGSADRAAIEYAQRRAGLYLTSIFDVAGHVWSADREVAPLRALMTETVQRSTSVHDTVRVLAASQRAAAIVRDADRVVRTEMQNARCAGAWGARSQRWDGETLLFRQTTTTPCRICLALYKEPTGVPRLYTRAEFEAGEAMGPNRREPFHIVIGATHPNCACAPPAAYHPAMQAIFAERAPAYASDMRRLGIAA